MLSRSSTAKQRHRQNPRMENMDARELQWAPPWLSPHRTLTHTKVSNLTIFRPSVGWATRRARSYSILAEYRHDTAEPGSARQPVVRFDIGRSRRPLLDWTTGTVQHVVRWGDTQGGVDDGSSYSPSSGSVRLLVGKLVLHHCSCQCCSPDER